MIPSRPIQERRNALAKQIAFTGQSSQALTERMCQLYANVEQNLALAKHAGMGMERSRKRAKAPTGKLRVYHFLCRGYGLDDIRRRRLKIATIADLNDPFELLPSSTDKATRARFRVWREQFDQQFGMLCFSRKWSNPVQWSHYAVKHTGLYLGFDIPAWILTPVRYRTKRITPRVDLLESRIPEGRKEMLKVLSTKYKHWHYENEVRCFTDLKDQDPVTRLYFADFSPKLVLKEVIVGPLSTVTREELTDALGDLAVKVALFKARLAFKTYTVTRQLNAKMWK